METPMVKIKAAALVASLFVVGAKADARTFDYCDDSSGETLSLLITVFDEMLDDPETTALERKSIVYQIERVQQCQVYKDYIAYCRTLKNGCDD
jgi:hypothetical protein